MSLRDYSRGYLRGLLGVLGSLSEERLEEIVGVLVKAYESGKTIFVLGNGGSASTASHFTCDLAKCTIKGGSKRFRVICLSDNVPLLTAWANDTYYENVFSEQLKNLVSKGDVVVAFSGSGNSPNVLKALEVANNAGAATVGFTGFKGGKMKDLARHCLIVPSDNMQQIEDAHFVLEHLICSFLRDEVVKHR